ncbi:hypothetical protein TNCV_4406191 [Trichonephila clavipes]|nr:hypothetical protein TNCV_4406191 [Trichonephila clavipes]
MQYEGMPKGNELTRKGGHFSRKDRTYKRRTVDHLSKELQIGPFRKQHPPALNLDLVILNLDQMTIPGADTFLSELPDHVNRRTLNLDRFNVHQLLCKAGLQWQLAWNS